MKIENIFTNQTHPKEFRSAKLEKQNNQNTMKERGQEGLTLPAKIDGLRCNNKKDS